VVFLGEPDLVTTQHIRLQNVRVVRREDQLRIAAVRFLRIEQANERKYDQWMEPRVDLVHKEQATVTKRVDGWRRETRRRRLAKGSPGAALGGMSDDSTSRNGTFETATDSMPISKPRKKVEMEAFHSSFSPRDVV